MNHNLAYIQRKIAHMMRMGIPAGFGPNGGACPDWAKIAEREHHDTAAPKQPERRKSRDIVSGYFGAACQGSLRIVATCDNSDPFAVARLRTHLLSGIEDDPVAVSKRCQATIEYRRALIQRSYEAWKAGGERVL